jgi:hypothetical protein
MREEFTRYERNFLQCVRHPNSSATDQMLNFDHASMIRIMSLFVNGNPRDRGRNIFSDLSLTPQVAVSVSSAPVHGNMDDKRVLARLLCQLFATDPLVAKLGLPR